MNQLVLQQKMYVASVSAVVVLGLAEQNFHMGHSLDWVNSDDI